MTTIDTTELAAIAGPVLIPTDPGYRDEITGFNLIHTHTPDVVVGATSAPDVAAALRWAASADVAVSVQATGHGANYPIQAGLLINTRRLNSVRIDAERRTATVGAGVRWADVLAAAAPLGFAALNGSSSSAGVVGYTVGGGLPVLGRAFGWAADHVRAAEVVTGDGTIRQLSPNSEPELFWALRGGKSTAGIVTELTFDLFPVSSFYGGGIYFAGEHGPELFDAYRAWIPTVPDNMCTALEFLRLPPLPDLPETIRGKFLTHLSVAYVGDPADGERLLAPMRATAPAVLDGVTEMPYAQVDHVYDDPHEPLPAMEKCSLISDLSPAAIEAFMAHAGPGTEFSVLKAGFRHMGAALTHAPEWPNAVNGRDAAFILETVGVPMGVSPEALASDTRALHAAMEPFSTGTSFVNLHGTPGDENDRARAWSPETYRRLQAVKATYDPANLLRLGHAIEPAR